MSNFHREHDAGGKFAEISFGSDKKIVHKSEIGKYLTHRNRQNFLSLIFATEKPGQVNELGDMSMEMQGVRTIPRGRVRSWYYKFGFGGSEYFVKRINKKDQSKFGGGAEEIKSMARAAELLKNIPGVKVVDYLIGFENQYNTFTISQWDESLRVQLNFYLLELKKNQQNSELLDELNKRILKIEEVLESEYDDVSAYNMAYDPGNDTIIIFDLKRKPRKTSEGAASLAD